MIRLTIKTNAEKWQIVLADKSAVDCMPIYWANTEKYNQATGTYELVGYCSNLDIELVVSWVCSLYGVSGCTLERVLEKMDDGMLCDLFGVLESRPDANLDAIQSELDSYYPREVLLPAYEHFRAA